MRAAAIPAKNDVVAHAVGAHLGKGDLPVRPHRRIKPQWRGNSNPEYRATGPASPAWRAGPARAEAIRRMQESLPHATAKAEMAWLSALPDQRRGREMLASVIVATLSSLARIRFPEHHRRSGPTDFFGLDRPENGTRSGTGSTARTVSFCCNRARSAQNLVRNGIPPS
jgi:hypothetical protein